MPTYDYECRACGHVFEAFQSMKDRPLAKCPACKGALRRRIGAGGGIIFKGTGFYETDYKRKAPPQAAGEKKETQAAGEKKETPAAEKKTEPAAGGGGKEKPGKDAKKT